MRWSSVIRCIFLAAVCGCTGPSYLVPEGAFYDAKDAPEPAEKTVRGIREPDGANVLLRADRITPVNSPNPIPGNQLRVTGYGTSHPLWMGGAALFIGGAVAVGIGSGMFVSGIGPIFPGDSSSKSNAGLLIGGGILLGIGYAAWLAGIPVWIVGGVRSKPLEVRVAR